MAQTLKYPVTIKGVGLHGGQPVNMIISPAPSGAGIVFVRTDVPASDAVVPARFDLVTDTQLCTKLTNSVGTSVGTVEHVMAALAGLGISDALLRLDGPEVPIMGGSSLRFIRWLTEVGVTETATHRPAIRMLREVRVEDGDKWAALSAAPEFRMDFRIEFTDAAIGAQSHQLVLKNGAFVGELSDCRTFGHLHEVEYMRSLGLARGGSLKNAIVVDRGRVLNPEGLRRPDEFVRHKMLDAVGDLALAGAPIIGQYTGVKAGHGLTNQLLRALFDTPDAWCWDKLAAGEGLFAQASAVPGDRSENPALAV
ncbi:MAG: UDP-3-O-acyl-N-acetylglucosamine deacetylase [Paracoccaceae bacterium]